MSLPLMALALCAFPFEVLPSPLASPMLAMQRELIEGSSRLAQASLLPTQLPSGVSSYWSAAQKPSPASEVSAIPLSAAYYVPGTHVEPPPIPPPAPSLTTRVGDALRSTLMALLPAPGAVAQTSTAPAPSLDVDLELDNPTRLLDTFHGNQALLDACWKTNSDLLFAYGYTLKTASKLEGARKPLQFYYDGKGVLAPYAALLLGDVNLEMKNAEEAIKWYGLAADALPGGARTVEARFGRAKALLQKGEATQAAADLQQLLNDYPRSASRHEIRLNLAFALEKSGQLEKAIEAAEWLYAWAPASASAEQAYKLLVQYQESQTAGYRGPNPAVQYRRALQLLKSGQVDPGLSLMLSLAQDPAVEAQLPRRFTFELAKAYFQAKQYREAASHLDAWYSRALPDEKPEALFWRALTQGRLGQFDEAIRLYKLLARTWPKSAHSERAMMKIGLLRLDEGSFNLAEEAFAAYRERYPKSKEADTAFWYVAWAQLRQGHYTEAQGTFNDFLKRFPRSGLVPGVRYWQGRMAGLQGNTEQAATFYRQVLASGVASHYQPLAEHQLESMGQPVELLPLDDKGVELPAAPNLPHPELLSRTVALNALGLRSWAQEELSLYEHTLKGREEQLAMAEWYRRTGNFYGARRIISNLGLGEGVPKLRDTALRWQYSYPMAFKDHLAQVALPEPVPLELIYAIMRQESEFLPWATSRVGARGLMQVMPETAREVCASRKVEPPILRQMYLPEKSVLYGAWHLEDLMKRLGRIPLVIAAYNAGPEAVERWTRERSLNPIDVFIEEISYTETRRYVKKVLTNLWVYRRLYGDGHTPLRKETGLQLAIAATRRAPAGAQDDSDADDNGDAGE